MFSTAQNVHVNNWLNEWRRYMESKSDETSDNLKMRLLEPIRVIINLHLAINFIAVRGPSILYCFGP